MPNFKKLSWLLFAFLFSIPLCFAHEDALVDHHDVIHINKSLSLSQLVSQVSEKFPEQLINAGLQQEVNALKQRGNSWLAAAPSISLRYQDDSPADDTGLREMETELNLPLWNWGQKKAAQDMANKAFLSSKTYHKLIKLKVAGLVRQALWNMELESIRFTQAKSILAFSEQFLTSIKRRVELGDLAMSDLLLVQSDHLQKRSRVVQAEAEMMHARQRYINLTQTYEAPIHFKEEKSDITEITEVHPKVSAILAMIKRKQAKVNWIKSAGSGNPVFTVGGKSERGDRNADDIDSMSFGISIPFGGAEHLAPDIAAANMELSELLAQRAFLFRNLNIQLHEAKHALEISRVELQMAIELKTISEKQLKMSQLSFDAGEINLIDFLKIQSQSNQAIRQAKESNTLYQKNIAMYNQAVGAQP